ncbi:MAG: class I SAM-dependent DNA methyltransferase [Polyangiaceae bacterium]|nr:class I SAM-dependent DNA methyltransferase [Polyangiaceae bacterium]
MSSELRLSPKNRRAILELLPRDRLAALAAHFELEVADRRSTTAHVDAIVRKRTLDFAALLALLTRDELKAGCEALGLDATGREKAVLAQRILGEPAEAEDPPAASTSSAPPPPDANHHAALKSKLRRFVLDTAGGYRGRDAATTFASRLLQCFGWPEAGPPDATLGASVAVVEAAQRAKRDVALLWNARRLLLDVVKHDVMLDYAWKELLRVCLQLDPVPQYVVLTNQRDVHLYDLGRDRETPRLTISLDDLPKYSEAFPFLAPNWLPGTTPTIINVSKVSGQVADLVARLYRSLKEQHPKRERDVVQFTLQCILTMFAEDIGLLPQEYFTSLLYDGARSGDVERRLGELFRLMSTRDVPGARAVPFFNGGLFTNPVTLPLGEAQLGALTKASEANWKYVEPHIFGSVFQGIMNDAERHKSGAHYTALDDIMRVVGPTIVEPWRQRIRDAKTLAELLEVRTGLLSFRVLDPACGSGNFLYVAFRELYRLDTELLARIREFPSTQGQGKGKISWGVGIQASNFFGIDINPFAVELAKVTLNIAKKIAFDERREYAADLAGQLELEVDPSLPLDNLDKNIVCADALFTDWPEVDAIVGNPPFLGDRKIRGELGTIYLDRLQHALGVEGVVDLCCYWFRRAHDRLSNGGRAGLVGTSGIRVGKAREASLDYIVGNRGTITNAVSSRLWPGDAALNVSMVNWVKGAPTGPCSLVIGDHVFEVPSIATHLQIGADVSSTIKIVANKNSSAMGVIFGADAFRAWSPKNESGFVLEKLRGDPCVRPVATGDDLLRGLLASSPDFCIYMVDAETEQAAARLGRAAFVHLKVHVYPMIKGRAESSGETHHYERWLRTWWQPREPSRRFFSAAMLASRVIVCSSPQARPIFVFLSTKFVPTNTLQVFACDDDYSFGIIQSDLHWAWTKAKGGKVRADIRYTNEVWTTFPWPQEPTEHEVAAVAAAGRNLRQVRDTLMKDNGWSLRALYQASEVAGSHPLKDAQAALDDAVRRAYGMPAGAGPLEFLLELNQLVAEDEAEGRQVQGPGVPRGMDPRDPRWISDDCIEPPPLGNG